MASAEKAARHYRSALAAYREGRLDEAVRSQRRALDLEPANADLRYDLAVMLHESRRFAEAAGEYRRVLRARDESVDALSNLALCLLATGDMAESERLARRAVDLAPGSGRALQNLGVVQRARGAGDAAVATLRRAAEIVPDSAAIWNDLGEAHLVADDYDAAQACFARALERDATFAPASSNLGLALAVNGFPAEAERMLRSLLARHPADAAALDALAVTLLLCERYDEAHDAARKGLERERDAKNLATLGCIEQALGRFDAAVEAFREAAERDPQSVGAHFNLANGLLTLGRFAEGWRAYRSRPGKRPLPEGVRAPELRDADLDRITDRRVMLVGDFGLGDELFFLRFAPGLRARGARLVYWGDPRLKSMLDRTSLFERVAGYDEEPPEADFLAHVADLPAALGDREDLPRPGALALRPQRERIERFGALLAEMGPAPYIGVTWQGGLPADRFDALRRRVLFKRIEPASLSAALAAVSGTIVVVQRRPAAEDLAAFGPRALDLSAANDDLEDMLALMTVLDEYIGVSNTNMHLRAGLGGGAKVLVPLPAEWRWQAAGAESPWFAGSAIYRQLRGGSWDDALARLARDLGATAPA